MVHTKIVKINDKTSDMVKINDKLLSGNLKLLRSHSGESQDSFAKRFGLKRTNITSYEGGTEPKLSFLINIVNHFNIKLDDLVCSDLNIHIELLDSETRNISTETGDSIKIQKEVEELKKDKVILSKQIALKDQQIQRLWKDIDELKSSKIK